MKNLSAVALIACIASNTGPAFGDDLNRDVILARSYDYWDTVWTIFEENKAAVLDDAPYYRYQGTATECSCDDSSPIKAILGESWMYGQRGTPYSFGARRTQLESWEFLGDGFPTKPLGESYCQFDCRRYMSPPAFAGCVDGMGYGGEITGLRERDENAWSLLSNASEFVGLAANPYSPETGTYYVWRGCREHQGALDGHYGSYELPSPGDLLVYDVLSRENDGVYLFIGEENGKLKVGTCSGDLAAYRCVDPLYLDKSYVQLLGDHWVALSVRTLYDGAATRFVDVNAARVDGEVIVEWTVEYLRHTWGFVVESSANGEEWEPISEYIRVDTPDDPTFHSYQWEGDAGSGFVRVLEIEEDTQRLSDSGPVKIEDE